jgi:hypothetical protein
MQKGGIRLIQETAKKIIYCFNSVKRQSAVSSEDIRAGFRLPSTS